jgi:hypothetical protein
LNKTAFELWYGKKPDLSHCRIFGCRTYVHIPRADRKKLDAKSIPCIFIGYPIGTKGYRFYDPVSQKVIISRDAIFDEKSYFLEQSERQNSWRNLSVGSKNQTSQENHMSVDFSDEKSCTHLPISSPEPAGSVICQPNQDRNVVASDPQIIPANAEDVEARSPVAENHPSGRPISDAAQRFSFHSPNTFSSLSDDDDGTDDAYSDADDLDDSDFIDPSETQSQNILQPPSPSNNPTLHVQDSLSEDALPSVPVFTRHQMQNHHPYSSLMSNNLGVVVDFGSNPEIFGIFKRCRKIIR